MITKIDQNSSIVEERSQSPSTTAPPSSMKKTEQQQQRRSSRRSSPTTKKVVPTGGGGRQKSISPSPPVRRVSFESCTSINSGGGGGDVLIPASIVTAAQHLQAATAAAVATTTTSSTRVSPSPPRSRSTSKAVSFNKRVRIRKIRRLEDMSEQEIEATYFNDRELMDIRNGLRQNIRSLVERNYREHQHETVDDYNNGGGEEEGCFCVRGLEHEFPQGKFRRKQLKTMSRGAVLEEQRLRRQFRVGRAAAGNSSSNNNKNSISSHSTCSESTLSTCDSSINSFAPTRLHNDEEADVAISEIYRIESKPAVQLALEFAKRDEAIADQIYFAHQAI